MDKLKENGPALWEYIHKDVSRVFGPENVIIAGGCVRDYILSQHFKDPFKGLSKFKQKDIDVFVNVDNELDFEFGLVDVKENPQWSYLEVRVESDPSGFSTENTPYFIPNMGDSVNEFQGLLSVADGFISADGTYWFDHHQDRNWWGAEVDILANPLEKFTGANLVSRFDNSLCFCWYTPEKGVVLEGAFNKTLETKKIEIVNDTPRTLQRVTSLLARYPEFKCDKLPENKKINLSGTYRHHS